MAIVFYVTAGLLACLSIYLGMTAAADSASGDEYGDALFYAALSVFVGVVALVIALTTWLLS